MSTNAKAERREPFRLARRGADRAALRAKIFAAASILSLSLIVVASLTTPAQARIARGGHVAAGRVAGPVHRPVHVHGDVHVRRPVVVAPIRPLPAVRPYYWGRVVAGVTIGAVIVASTQPVAPSPDLCWFWSDSSKSRGYWNYCTAPAY